MPKVTLQGGPDNAAHTFVADENTTFRKRRDPITLGDIQVGDMVRVEGRGEETVLSSLLRRRDGATATQRWPAPAQ